MVVAGMAGLLVVLTGASDWVFTAFGEKSPSAHVSSFWLILQSLAVIAGGIGAWRGRSFVVAGVGVASALIRQTAVGHITFFPGLLMLVLITGGFRSFGKFQRGLPRLPPEGLRR